jgi:hypothetical protein
MTKRNKTLLGAAVAGILGAMASTGALAADKSDKKMMKAEDVQCSGVNACKGKSGCAGAKSACAGMNGCKGQGWVKVSKEACDQLGGNAMPPKEHKMDSKS